MTTLYKRSVRVVVGTLDVSNLRCTFSVTRTLTPSPDKAEITITNLQESNVAALEYRQRVRGVIPVQLDAGYEDGRQTLFLGHMRSSGTYDDGAGNSITTIAAGDGEEQIRKSRINVSIAPGTPPDQVLKDIVKALGVSEGNLKDAVALVKQRFGNGTIFAKGTVLTGSASREMTNVCRSFGLVWSIRQGKLQITERGKAFEKVAVLLSPTSGMLGTPTVDAKGILSVKSLLNPGIFPGRLLVLESKRLQGQYLITDCADTGDTHGGEWSTDIKAKRY